MSLDTIFARAIEIASDPDRAAYLDGACGADAALRGEAEQLVRDHFRAGAFLERPAARVAATADDTAAERPGTVIGPYRLMEQIGEGGFGLVFVAEQQRPVRRNVALKVIKPGMDSRQVVARFEAERQALALMDHPNIAKVLDGGTTPAGRPFFVMELIRGVPITQFCDDGRLTTRERLGLFAGVCAAVQHAHQKGVIHRDLKPSNILVTSHDGTPVVKVIDFGVAKAVGQRLTEKTVYTQFTQMVGTPLYMSPEQAGQSGLDVDTRTDVYALGVLLYELLTGTTPFDQERLRAVPFDEVRRIIREEEPAKPSTRISTLGLAAATVSAHRRSDPAGLSRLVRGELDWIVMKALEKDRARRYETASAFAADVRRYLADEPVLACPPSAGYRLRKFARRKKAAVAVTGLVLFFLVLLGSGIGWAVRDRAARESRTAAQADLILAEVEQLERDQRWPEALAGARQAEAAVAAGEVDPATARRVRDRLADLEFIDRLERIRMEGTTTERGKFDHAGADRAYARAFRDRGVDVDALEVGAAVDRLKARPALAVPLGAALDDWASARRAVAATDAAGWMRLVAVARGIDPEPLRDQLRSTWGQPEDDARDELRRLADAIDVRAQHPATLVSLARALQRSKRVDSAVRLLRDARYVRPGDFWVNYELGFALYVQMDCEGAARFYTAAAAIRPSSAAAHNNLGQALRGQKKQDEAVASFTKAVELDPESARYRADLGYALGRRGKVDEAVAAYREAIRLQPAYGHHAFGCYLRDVKLDDTGAVASFTKAVELDPNNAGIHNDLGSVLRRQGKVDEAIAAFKEATKNDAASATLHINLGDALGRRGKSDEAVAAYREAIRLQPAYGHHAFGCYLRDAKRDYERAVASFTKAVELDPESARYRADLGYALGRRGKVDEAVAAYREAIRLQPAYGHHAFGCYLRDVKLDDTGAVASFTKAVELDPNNAGIHNDLGSVLRRQGKVDEAIAAFKEATKNDAANALYHINLGFALGRRGKSDEAIAALKSALAIAPQNAHGHNALAWLLATCSDARLRDPGQAVALAKKAAELDPKDSRFSNTLGVAHYRAGDWKAARAALEKSTEQQKGGDSFDWFFLAMTHWQLGEKGQAREWYDRAVRWVDTNQPKDEELRRFRAEAAELLGLNEKPSDGS